MQNSLLVTIEGQLKVKILSAAAVLLLIGLHPVHVFADAASSDPAATSTVTTAPTTPTSTPTTNPNAVPTTPVPSDTTSSTSGAPIVGSSSNTQQSTAANTTESVAPTATTNNNSSTSPQGTATAPNNTSSEQSDNAANTVTNQTTSKAQSGNASVSSNSSGGNATSGNAQIIANALNILSSSTDVKNGDLSTSITNIDGSDNQNVVIDPTTMGQSSGSQNNLGNTQVNSADSGVIDNKLNLYATSGDASVTNNQIGGNATSGNASVDANLVNITNSTLTSGQYYFGVINIYGNLSSDILLSPDFVSQLLAENPSLLSASNASLSNNVNQTINDQVNASAVSGDAAIENNGNGGNATSGSATTSIDTFNLINSQITGNNALLVFINVLGTWEGVIIGAPTGAMAAAYGNDASGQNITNTVSNSDATLASATNETIDNTINATATSGSATVADNNVGGNATTGKAVVGVNLLNILNSNFSLTGWFGVLFINVFGNWTGSFGLVTPAAATVITPTTTITTDAANIAPVVGRTVMNNLHTFLAQSSTPSSSTTSGHILGTTASANITNPLNNDSGSRIVASTSHGSRTWWLPAAAGMLLATGSLSLEQVLKSRQHKG